MPDYSILNLLFSPEINKSRNSNGYTCFECFCAFIFYSLLFIYVSELQFGDLLYIRRNFNTEKQIHSTRQPCLQEASATVARKGVGFAAWLVYNKNYNKEEISIKNYSTSEHNGRISFIFTHSFISATSLINKLIIFLKNVMPIAQCCLHLNHPSA